MLTYQAPAKINLTLEVLGRRPDGYHEVATVLQTIKLWDTIVFREAADLRLLCEAPDLRDEENLCLKAAELLKSAAGHKGGAEIELIKRIPVAAGLGGGSTDAATTLLGLDALWGLGLGITGLLPLAEALGADVSFFLYRGTALGEGIGAKVTPLPAVPPMWLVLLHPPFSFSEKTRRLYVSLDRGSFSRGEATSRLISDLQDQRPIERGHLFNVFERVAYRVFPGLEAYRTAFLEAEAPSVHLSGTGPTLYTPLEDEAKARRIYEKLKAKGLEAYLVQSLGATETPLSA